MNQEQLLGAIRSILSVLGGWAVGHGYISGDQLTMFTGAVMAIAPLIWSFLAHTDKAMVASAQSVGQAQVLVSDPKLVSPGVQLSDPAAATATVPVPKAPAPIAPAS